MEQLILHLFGDYVFQNQWMANRKTISTFPALVHVVFYSTPFLLLGPSREAFAVIAATHFIIDRFRLAKYWCAFFGIGCTGAIHSAINWTIRLLWCAVIPARPTMGMPCGTPSRPIPPQLAYVADPPNWMAIWLLIIVDNAAHLAINYCALRWL